MSSIRRLIAGSGAAWARMIATLALQIVLVPLYLHYWDAETYGVWLSIQAIAAVIQTMDAGHQDYVQGEFFRAGVFRKRFIRRTLWSSAPFSLFSGMLVSSVIAVAYITRYKPAFISSEFNTERLRISEHVLLVFSVYWALLASFLGVVSRVMSATGYYARSSWWSTATAVISTIAPLPFIAGGAGLERAGEIWVGSMTVISLLNYWDSLIIVRANGLSFTQPRIRFGWRNFLRSQIITVRYFFEMARQQGSRLVMLPLAGAAPMAAYSTMRTGANSVLHGLATITNPLMPEMMRFLVARDQSKVESSFALVWLPLILVMGPGSVVLQAVAGRLFRAWTRGAFQYDGVLFALLTLTVLIYALAQSAQVIIAGHNILRVQLTASLLAGAVAVGGMAAIVPKMGIRGAGIALVMSEALSAWIFVNGANRWMQTHDMRWPWEAFSITAAAMLNTTVGMFACVAFPASRCIVAMTTIAISIGFAIIYWHTMPELAKMRAAELVRSFLARAARTRNTA